MPRPLSRLTIRTAGQGADVWEIHNRAKAARKRGEDVITLSVGDPDMDTPPHVVDAAVAALRSGDTHYTETLGRPALRAALADRHARRTGDPVDAGNVAVTSGAQNALFFASLLLLEPGDDVVVLDPAYATYPAVFEATGATITPAVMPAATGFRLDPQALRAAVGPATKAIAFANPNNPTGVTLTAEELAVIADVADAHDLWVIADEVYGDLVFDRPFVPAASIERLRPRLITIGSFSKAFAMTGWRCGYFVGPREVVEAAGRVAVAMLYGLPGFVQEAALAALSGDGAAEAEMREIYRRRRDLAAGLLRDIPNVRADVPEAGMFMMLDVSLTGLDGARFAADLFEATGVSVIDGAGFSPQCRSFVRLSFAVSDAELAEGCARIARFVRELASPA